MQTTMTFFYVLSFFAVLVSFLFAFYLFMWVKRQKQTNTRIGTIGKLIKDGANTFMKKEYAVLAKFSAVCALLIFIFLPSPIFNGYNSENTMMAVSYIFGTVSSAIAGKIGIFVATMSNTRTSEASVKGIKNAFLTAFRGGSIMGLSVVGLCLLGVSAVFLITGNTTALLGFSFGASSLALFAKAGGGIFTKTADISADLVGKVELSIPEDDPRNPAVIADNVGDNVGDVAGMGADLFDSNVASMAAALVMASSLDSATGNVVNTCSVFAYSAIGLISSILGIWSAKLKDNQNPTRALNSSTYLTTFIFLILSALATYVFEGFKWEIWLSSAVGLIVGVVIGMTTDYFTNDTKKPVKEVAKASALGSAFTLLSGMSYSFISVLPSMAGIAVSALFAYNICAPLGEGYAMFGISMAAVGMLSIVATVISNDAYGPIVDNARGLAEMGGLSKEALDTTDKLDSAGNTVKAITKGFAIAAAGLTVISLLGAYMSEVNSAAQRLGKDLISCFDILDSKVFFGILIGAAVPAVFSAMLILGVNKNAARMVLEIKRQFKEIIGLKEGKPGVAPDYNKCINIATGGALKELIPAGLFSILITLITGFIGGANAIGGFLLGNIVSGLLLALFMSNAGGLWDNSKKYIETKEKGTTAHKSAVVGDTVGDPFKDTAGPSINTQITVVSLVASLFSSAFISCSFF